MFPLSFAVQQGNNKSAVLLCGFLVGVVPSDHQVFVVVVGGGWWLVVVCCLLFVVVCSSIGWFFG